MESTKNSDIRVNNRKRLVDTLFRQGPMTKLELANKLDMSLPTATFLLKELIQKGLVVTGETVSSTGGRKPVLMVPVVNIRYTIGIEVSMYEIRMVLLDLSGKIYAKALWSYDMKADHEFWHVVDGLLHSFINENMEDPTKLFRVNLAIQMPMDQGKICLKKNDPENLHLDRDIIETCISYPINIQNSARMAAIAQIWSGIEENDFVFLSIGTYVSGAIVSERKVLNFDVPNGMFGSILVNDGYLENYLSTRSLCEKAGVDHIEQFLHEIKMENSVCMKLWDEYLEILIRVLYNLRKIFGYKIVIGGGICPFLMDYEGLINEKLQEMEEFKNTDPEYLKVSDIGVFGAAMGAAMLEIDHFLESGFEELEEIE